MMITKAVIPYVEEDGKVEDFKGRKDPLHGGRQGLDLS